VIGSHERPFVIALVNMDYENMAKWAEAKKIIFTTFADLSQKEHTRKLIREEISKVNHFLPEVARVRKFVVMHKEFDPDEAEMTRTRKLKRKPIEDKYHDLISMMYGGEREFIVESEVKYQDGRKGKITMTLAINTID
jgi:long-chain acyl-CoA synthetase